MGDFTKDTIRGVNNLRKVCKEGVWNKSKRLAVQAVAPIGISIVFILFLLAYFVGLLFNYLGNVMLPSRKEKGGA